MHLLSCCHATRRRRLSTNNYYNTVAWAVARRIDFRELVRDLFSLYKTRIWMQQLEPETTPSGGPMQAPYSPQEVHGGMPDPMAGGGGSIDMGGMHMGGPML